jgi:hypothetical protein
MILGYNQSFEDRELIGEAAITKETVLEDFGK